MSLAKFKSQTLLQKQEAKDVAVEEVKEVKKKVAKKKK